MFEVIATGPSASVQDDGRHGYAALGVPRSGAFDRAAHGLANRLVGNRPSAATIECTLGGLVLMLHRAATIAVTGAPVPGVDHATAVTLPAGALVSLGTPIAGLRSYVAVRGGVAVAPVLGSRSRDTLSGIGPAPLRPGDLLPIGTDDETERPIGEATGWQPGPSRLPVVIGPRADWFTDDAVRTLIAGAWQVRADSDRVGVRLDGPRLSRRITGELPSEPTLPGAVQVPPDGRPILLGPDAPVTGGYPVIAVLRRRYLDHVAQLRPGDFIQFRQ